MNKNNNNNNKYERKQGNQSNVFRLNLGDLCLPVRSLELVYVREAQDGGWWLKNGTIYSADLYREMS